MKFQMKPLILTAAITARLGAGVGAANNVDDKEVNKFVKLVGDSQYDLCAVGNQIEGAILSLEVATLDGYSIGSVQQDGRLEVTFEGTEAAGTGAIAVGDYVVAGTPVAKGTALPGAPKVRKATTQTGMYHAWRVVSLGSGNGSVGTTGVIERVS